MSDFHTVNPVQNETLKKYSHLDEEEIERRLEKLKRGAELLLPVKERVQKLQRLAEVLREKKDELGILITLEMGKPLTDAKAEIEKSATAADYYARHLEEFSVPEKMLNAKQALYEVWAQPTGVLFAVMPWNFPIWQIMRVLSPALAVGNPVALKHSDLVAGTAERFTEIVQSIWGETHFQNLRIDHEQSSRVIADPRVRAVTMTGSSRGGREIAATAGKHLKKVVLELGGSDAYIVFDDADIQKAAALCAEARLVNNGQSCVSGKRFIVAEKSFDLFIDHFMKGLKAPVIGDPVKPETKLGPLASQKFKEGLLKQTKELKAQGGEKIFEREMHLPAEFAKGAFFAPQAWLVQGDERIVREEEFFGPVALVMRFKNEEQALKLANASVYGLGGGVFSRDRDRLLRIGRGLECGFVGLNDTVRSDAVVPFGGVKDSGFGRELGPHGFREFLNFKTVGGAAEIQG